MEKVERWLALADEAVPDISTAEAMAGQVEVCPGEGPRYGAPNVDLGLGCLFFFKFGGGTQQKDFKPLKKDIIASDVFF